MRPWIPCAAAREGGEMKSFVTFLALVLATLARKAG